MSKDKNITLIICGNADSNVGYQQLVAFEPAFYPEDKQYSAVMMNESFYTLQIRNDVTILIKTVNNVCSFGQMREGRLRIGISIPAGYCISNPKLLIDEIEAAFKSNYMIQGLQKWQFKPSEYDVNIFNGIIQKYPLLPSPSAYRVMSASGNVGYVFTPRIMELLKDYQYKEFQPYGEIVIAETGNATSGEIRSLSIPRHSIYDVFVMQSGRITQKLDPITDTRRTWTFNVYPDNQTIYGPAQVEFSIDELKGLLSGDKDFSWGQVSLDERQETVSIKIQSFPENLFIGRLSISGEKIDLSRLKLNNGHSIKSVSAEGEFKLKGREIYETWTVSYPSDRTLVFSPSELNFQMQLEQRISVSKPKPIVPQKDVPFLPGNKEAKQIDDNYVVFPVEATIVNPREDVNKSFFVNIYMTQSEGGWEYARKITLSKSGEDQDNNNTYWGYKGEIPIPKDMIGKGAISFAVRATVPTLDIHFSNDAVELKKNSPIKLGEDKPGNGLRKSIPLLYAILLALAMLLIGGAVGWWITKWKTSSSTTENQLEQKLQEQIQLLQEQLLQVQLKQNRLEQDQQAQDQTLTAENQLTGSAQPNTIKKEYDNKLSHINSVSFNFSEINDYKDFLKDPVVMEIDKNSSPKNKLSYHVKVAEEVYKVISSYNSTSESIKNAVADFVLKSNTNLKQEIRAAICASYLGDFRSEITKKYTTSEKNTAVFLARSCKSYQDLYNIPDNVFNSSN